MIQQPTIDNKTLAGDGLTVVQLLMSQRPRELLAEFRQQLLHELAGKGESADRPELGRCYREAYSALYSDHNRLVQDVLHYLNDTLSKFINGTLESGEAAFRGGSSLSLMGAAQLEEQALITALRQRTDGHYQALLWPLCKRLACLGNGVADPELNPLAPLRFCLALRYGLNRAGIDAAVKRDIYRGFERLFLARLGEFYQQLNDGLAAVGINPDTRFNVVKAGSQTAAAVEPGTGQPALESEPAISSATGVDVDEMEQGTDTLLKQLSQLLGRGGHLELHESHRQTIEQVDSVLREFSHNTRLGGEVKAVLSLLHMPLLKVALADPEFFCRPEHPARQLLVHMVEAATDWLQGEEREFGVFQQIRDVVERLLRNPGVRVNHFAEELLSFRGHVRQLQLKARQRARHSIGTRQRMDSVTTGLRHRIGDQQLPEAIDHLLNCHWRDYLRELMDDMGEDCHRNSRWQDALSAVDDLLWGLQISPDNRHECKRWRQNYLWLEAVLASGLDHLKINSGQCQQILASVRQVFQPLLEQQRQPPAAVRSLQQRPIVEQSPSVLGQMTERQWLEQMQRIPSGTWFRFASGRREQLVWRNLRTMQFQFCESAGGKSVMRTGDDMARLLAEGTVQLETVEAISAGG